MVRTSGASSFSLASEFATGPSRARTPPIPASILLRIFSAKLIVSIVSDAAWTAFAEGISPRTGALPESSVEWKGRSLLYRPMPPSLRPTRRSSSRLLVDFAILPVAFSLAMDLFIDETISWLSSVSPTPFVLSLLRYSSSLAREVFAACSRSSASFVSLFSSVSSRWWPRTFCVNSDRLLTPVFCFAWAKSASSSASLAVCSFAVRRRLVSSSNFSPMVPLSRSRSGFSASVKVSWRAVLDSSRCLFHSSILDASLASICFLASSRFLDSSWR